MKQKIIYLLYNFLLFKLKTVIMKFIKPKPKYVEWLNAEEMHQASRAWVSELEFIKDEQHFFEDLIKSYTLQLIDSDNFSKSKTIVETLNKLQKKNKVLLKAVKNHENKLEIMVDGIDEPEKEKEYKNIHRELIIKINNYFKAYKVLKTNLFEIVKEAIKKQKQKLLLD
jgi:hypothetical protein